MYSMTPLEVNWSIFISINFFTYKSAYIPVCTFVHAISKLRSITLSETPLGRFEFFSETRIIWHWGEVIYVEISQTTKRANSLSVIGKEYFLSRSKINLKQAYLQLNLFDENLSKHETLRNIDVNHTSKLK